MLNFVPQIFFSFYARRLANYAVPNWLTSDEYLQGLGLTQSLPGPLFNFSAYIGAAYKGLPGALIAWVSAII
jgi:chromate transporter